MNTPTAPTPARPSLDELFDICAANLKHDDVTLAPFTPVHIRPVAPADDNLDEAMRARFNQFSAHAPAQFLRAMV
jgi:hypothetical protein